MADHEWEPTAAGYSRPDPDSEKCPLTGVPLGMEGCDEWWDFRESRTEGAIKLAVKGATQEQLALGIAVARKVFADLNVEPGRAGACRVAISAYSLDSTLPAPDDEVLKAAAAVTAALEEAVSAAGGDQQRGDYLAALYDSDILEAFPTLRAYRDKYG